MNNFVGMGRLTRDVEARYTTEGLCIASYTLAIDRPGKTQEKKTDFIRVKAFGKAGEFAEKYFRKGLRVLVSGPIQTETYTNKDGQKVNGWEINARSQEFADGKGGGDATPAPEKKQEQGESWMQIPDGADAEGLPWN